MSEMVGMDEIFQLLSSDKFSCYGHSHHIVRNTMVVHTSSTYHHTCLSSKLVPYFLSSLIL